MTRIFVYIAFCVSLFFSVNCYSADLPTKCFDRFANFDLPFEIYPGDNWFQKYIQPLQSEDELSTDDVPFIEYADVVSVAPLCSGNFIAVWTFSHEKFPVPLTGRIFDSKLKTVYTDFPISEKSKTEDWEHSVSTLYDDGFVVTWKTWKTRARKEIILRGRIFNNAGKPKGKSFDIYSIGNNGGCSVYGLPKGGFVTVWNYDKQNSIGSALLRIFNSKGKPKTKAIVIASDSKDKWCEYLKPRGYITKDGNINVFMICQTQLPDQNYFFRFARRFSEAGKPLTDVLIGKAILSLEGFSYLKEQYLKERKYLKAERKGE